MSCALERNSKDRFKPEDVASGSSTTKNLILYYHSAHDHQTWLRGDLPLGAPAYKVT